MKKILFFVWLMLFACVFANAQTVDTLDKAKNDYLFGNGAYTVGSDGPRTINISCDSPNVGDIETGETVKVLVTFDSPAENWDVLTEPTLAEISYSGALSQYVFEIILVAGNTLGNDTFKLVGDGEIELTFNVVAAKKDFTVTANGETIDPTEPLNLNEFSGNGFKMQVYDDQGELVKTTQFTFVDPVPVEGDIVVSRQKMTEYINIYKSSGSGKAKIEIKKDGYNDFIFYVEYPKPVVPVTGVEFVKDEITLSSKFYGSEVLDYSVLVSPENATDKSVTYEADNYDLVQINSTSSRQVV